MPKVHIKSKFKVNFKILCGCTPKDTLIILTKTSVYLIRKVLIPLLIYWITEFLIQIQTILRVTYASIRNRVGTVITATRSILVTVTLYKLYKNKHVEKGIHITASCVVETVMGEVPRAGVATHLLARPHVAQPSLRPPHGYRKKLRNPSRSAITNTFNYYYEIRKQMFNVDTLI